MTMTIGNRVEMDVRQLSDFEEENTWKLVKITIKQYSPIFYNTMIQ